MSWAGACGLMASGAIFCLAIVIALRIVQSHRDRKQILKMIFEWNGPNSPYVKVLKVEERGFNEEEVCALAIMYRTDFSLPPWRIHNALYRLEANGLLVSREQLTNIKDVGLRRRRIYKLTHKGIQTATTLILQEMGATPPGSQPRIS